MKKKINILVDSKALRISLIVLSIAVTVYFVLFSSYPPIHDALHEFRHTVGVPCH